MLNPLGRFSITGQIKEAFALTDFTRQAYLGNLFHRHVGHTIQIAAPLLKADAINLIKTACNGAMAATTIGMFVGASGVALPSFVLTAMRTSVAAWCVSLFVEREGANQAAQQTLARLQASYSRHNTVVNR